MATLRIADQVGRVLSDRYRLLRPLGTGASAHVYVGEDVSLRRRVAVKVLHPALADDAAFLRRFRAEARVVAALRHPNILRVYDWGEDDGSPYLVTELLEGGSLRSLLDAGHLLSPAQAAKVGADAARGLAHAHRRGLVHRDVKPANLLFDEEGRVSVADFGLARALAEASWTEPAGAVVGTARYAAPEQARGQSLDARADVYALALVLVEATTGEVPFTADTTIGTIMARLDRPIPVPPSLGALAAPLAAAGTADPGDRLDAIGFAVELDRAAGLLPPPSALALSGPMATGILEVDPQPTAIPGARLRPAVPDEPSVWIDERLARGDGHPGSAQGWEAIGVDGGGDNGADGRAATAWSNGARGPAAVWTDDDPTGPGITPPRRLPLIPAATPVPAAAPAATPTPAPTEAVAVVAPVGDVGGERPGWVTAAPFDGEEDQPLRDDLGPRPVSVAVPADSPPPRRRWRWRRVAFWLLALLLAATVAGGALVTTGVIARATPTEAVPSVVGQTTEAAGSALTAAHLGFVVSQRAYDNHAAAGVVLRQLPAVGRLRRGAVVSVTVSLGLPPVAVPSLANKTEAAAVAALRAGHLVLGSVTEQASLSVADGLVISWSGTGTDVAQQTRVNLVVSSGLPVVSVPTLSGPTAASFTAARAALAGVQLTATESDAYNASVPKGQVVSITPVAGTKVRIHTGVAVVISKGPDTVSVPNVQGYSVSVAASLLENDGLGVSGVEGNPTNSVTGTNPSLGTVVVLGTSVEIVTS